MKSAIDYKALHLISYGLYVVSSKYGKKMNGQIVNTVVQVTAQPPRIAVSVNKHNLTHDYIQRSQIFSVSVLDENTPMRFIGLFGFKSGRDVDKLSKTKYEKGIADCPIVTDYTLGILEVKVINQIDVGTHTVFIGDVKSAKTLREGTPLTYATYHQIKGGKAPKTAPTYHPDVPETAPTYSPPRESLHTVASKPKKGQQYQCEVCGWMYNPDLGDPEHDIPPRIPFNDLPADWTCPLCGANKDQFAPI
jgi:flavin reductase (DIM6/NTAB) family NADH-FMN oxidoreductase RutF/rubredoxin